MPRAAGVCSNGTVISATTSKPRVFAIGLRRSLGPLRSGLLRRLVRRLVAAERDVADRAALRVADLAVHLRRRQARRPGVELAVLQERGDRPGGGPPAPPADRAPAPVSTAGRGGSGAVDSDSRVIASRRRRGTCRASPARVFVSGSSRCRWSNSSRATSCGSSTSTWCPAISAICASSASSRAATSGLKRTRRSNVLRMLSSIDQPSSSMANSGLASAAPRQVRLLVDLGDEPRHRPLRFLDRRQAPIGSLLRG